MSEPRRDPDPHEPVDLDVTVRLDEVHRLLGYPEGRRPPLRVASQVEDLVAEARRLVEARGAFVTLPPSRSGEVGLPQVEAEALVLGLVTVGPGVEAEASARLGRGEATAGLVLDAAGSAAAEEAADRLCCLIAAGGVEGGSTPAIPCRLSPGYGAWPLEAQRELFELLPAEAVGVRLLPSLLMEPRKSVSFAMWLGAGGRPSDAASGCSRCGLERCRYRRAPRADERGMP